MVESLRAPAACLVTALLLLQPGCGGSDAAGSSSRIAIESIGWYEENIDPSAWTTPPPDGQTAFYDFFIHYTGELGFADLQSVRVYAPTGYSWNLLPDASFLDTTRRVIGGWRRMYGSPTNVLPIGSLRAEIVLKDGTVVTAARNVPAPGSTVTGGFTTMHTEDRLSPAADSAPMVRRAIMGAATLDAASQSITVSFSTADPLAYNGWVWLLDGAGTRVAGFFPFRDPATGAIAPQLGGVLHGDGTSNTLTLRAADLQLETGASFPQIAKVQVVITDGRQYAQRTDGVYFDCRSIGPTTTLTLR